MSNAVETTNRNTRCAAPANVTAVRHVCREHVLIEMTAPAHPSSSPGQFIQIRCRNEDAAADQVLEWSEAEFPRVTGRDFDQQQAFTRRPFSIADRWMGADGTPRLAVISRAVGTGTRWLDTLRAGDVLDITGPLGQGFRVPHDRSTPLVLIGGGVGIPPLLYLSRILRERGHEDVTVLIGVRSRDLLPLELTSNAAADGTPSVCLRLPLEPRYPAIIATDDGSLGMKGLVTDALAAWVAHRQAPSGTPLIMACGPEKMLAAVAADTRARGYAAQLCIERSMGCGLGTCLSCVVRMRDSSKPSGWRWALACTDGPVFDRDTLPDYD